ncbi:MAG: hypothetical protein ACREPV_01310 [Lysobacter sp.]
MNTMTGIAREGMRRAQGGDWTLADAIELLSRNDNPDGAAEHHEAQLLCGIPEGGRLKYLVWVIAFDGLECEHCDEEEGGDAGATDEPCDACGGERITDNPFAGEAFWNQLAVVTTLNGDVIWDCQSKCDDRDMDAVSRLIASDTRQMVAAARQMVAAYQASLAKPEQTELNIARAA